MIFQFVINKFLKTLDIHTLEVVKKSSSSMLVKVLGMLAGFIVSIILGRTIGPEGLGIISLAERVVGILLILAMLGMNNVILKEVSIAYELKQWRRIGNVIYTALRINIPVTLILSAFVILISPWLANEVFKEPQVELPLIISAAIAIPQVYSRIMAAGINGYRKIWQSQLVNNTLSVVFTALCLGILLLFNVEITVIRVVIIYAIGRIFVAVTMGVYWNRLFRFKSERSMDARAMLKVALPLLIVASAGMVAANADTLMLGWLSSTEEIGLYSVAARLGLLTNVFLAIAISTLSPKIAALYAERKLQALEKMIQETTKGLFFIGIITFILYWAFGKYILSLWGDDFIDSYWILIIIAIGQLFNISTGSTGVFLIMTRHEKVIGLITFISASINIILNLILIPKYGAIGAAAATGSTVIIENIVKVVIVKRKTGILTIPFFSRTKH